MPNVSLFNNDDDSFSERSRKRHEDAKHMREVGEKYPGEFKDVFGKSQDDWFDDDDDW